MWSNKGEAETKAGRDGGTKRIGERDGEKKEEGEGRGAKGERGEGGARSGGEEKVRSYIMPWETLPQHHCL